MIKCDGLEVWVAMEADTMAEATRQGRSCCDGINLLEFWL